MNKRDELIELLKGQIGQLSIMSKIELGDDVISKIQRLQEEIEGEDRVSKLRDEYVMDPNIIYPIPGIVYEHYKGGLYEVSHLAKHTETGEVLVIYRSTLYGTNYARPLEQWFQTVDEHETRFRVFHP